MADAWFTKWLTRFEARGIDWDYYDVWVLLVDDTFSLGSLTTTTYIYEDAIVNSEVPSGSGYTTGGKLFIETTAGFLKDGDGSLSLNNTTGNIVWANSTITARYAILYTKTENAVIALYDFGVNVSSSSSDFTIKVTTDHPVLDFNYNPTHFIGSQAWDHLRAFSSGYDDSERRYHLVSSEYVFDPANSAYSQIEPYIVNTTSTTYSTLTSAIESGELVYRGTITFGSGAASPYRYVIAVERFAEIWMMIHDFGSDQPATAQQVILQHPNGIHKVVLVI